MDINHAVTVYEKAQRPRPDVLAFHVYDPNYTDGPRTLLFDTVTRTFSYDKTFYFPGRRGAREADVQRPVSMMFGWVFILNFEAATWGRCHRRHGGRVDDPILCRSPSASSRHSLRTAKMGATFIPTPLGFLPRIALTPVPHPPSGQLHPEHPAVHQPGSAFSELSTPVPALEFRYRPDGRLK